MDSDCLIACSLVYGSAVVEIQVSQAEGGNEDGEQPTEHHGDELVPKHAGRFPVEDVVTRDEPCYSLVHEAGIGVQQQIDYEKGESCQIHGLTSCAA